jgi:putative transposase
MPHSFNKIWIHAIWGTKNRMPLLSSNIEKQIHNFIKKQFEELRCPVRIINGMPDHIHCLFLLNPQIPVAEVIKQIKGSSSHYMNTNDFIEVKFAWQTGYAAYSVSESQLEKVFTYISNQKIHHAKKSFKQEYAAYLSLYGFENK